MEKNNSLPNKITLGEWRFIMSWAALHLSQRKTSQCFQQLPIATFVFPTFWLRGWRGICDEYIKLGCFSNCVNYTADESWSMLLFSLPARRHLLKVRHSKGQFSCKILPFGQIFDCNKSSVRRTISKKYFCTLCKAADTDVLGWAAIMDILKMTSFRTFRACCRIHEHDFAFMHAQFCCQQPAMAVIEGMCCHSDYWEWTFNHARIRNSPVYDCQLQ